MHRVYKKMLNSEFLFIESLATQSPMKVCNVFLKSKFETCRDVIPDLSQINKIKEKKKKKREREDGRGKRNNIFPSGILERTADSTQQSVCRKPGLKEK